MKLTLDQAIKKINEAFKSGKAEAADQYYRDILKVNTRHPLTNHNMGLLAVAAGKLEESLPYFKTALEANPGITEHWFDYMDALIKLDKITDAEALLHQAQKKGAKADIFDQLKKKLSQATQKDSDQANKEILKKAIELTESGKYNEAICLVSNYTKQLLKYPELLTVLSHCSIMIDDLPKAIFYLDKAKSLNPEMASVGWNEARILLKQQKINEALCVAVETNKLFPTNVEGLNVLGSCLRISGNFSESLRYLNKAIEQQPDFAEALINRALISLHQNDKVSALTDLESAYHLKPHIKQIWDLIISLKMEFNDFEKVIIMAESMIEIDPLNEKVYAAKALCHQYLQDFEKAIKAYKKAIEIKPDYATAYDNMGSALKGEGKLDKAIQAYKKAIDIEPEFATAHNNLGAVLKETGKLDEAIRAYRKAIDIKPYYAEASYNMGNALKDKGKLGEALDAFKKAISIKPYYADAYYNMGSILDNQGRLDEAVSKFQKAFAIRSNIAPTGDAALAPATTGLFFELTNKCNFHCVFCPSDSQKRNLGSMDLELVKKLYTEASEKKLASYVNLHLMGEPTLHPNLIEILNFGASKNIKTDLVTNGSTLVAKNIAKILDSLYGTITASHMTPTEETYHFRGKVGLSWERYISNLRLLVREYMKRIKREKLRKNDLTIRVMSTMNTAANCTITETKKEARAILKEWSDFVALVEQELGLDTFKRINYDTHDLLKENNDKFISYPLQEGIQLKFWKAFTFANTRVSEDYELEDRAETAYCPKPFRDVGVLWNGDVTLCGLDHDGELSVGNINYSSLEEIIQNDEAKKLRASMLGRCSLPSVCKTCQAKPIKRQSANEAWSDIS